MNNFQGLDVHELAEYLNGTPSSLEAALAFHGIELDEVPIEFLSELDALTMCCETCAWWVDAHEVDDDGNCEDCR